MTDDPYVVHVPTGTGGRGLEEVATFYATFFVGRTPEDLRFEPVSRTVGADRIVDEMVVSFTHDIEMPWFLPGIAPTGRRVEIPVVLIVGICDGLVDSEHVYWDRASVFAQLGLDGNTALPVLGAEQAEVVRDRSARLNTLLT